MEIFSTTLDEILDWHDPCDYKKFSDYKTTITNNLIGVILGREQILVSDVFEEMGSADEFKNNVLYPLFEKRIKYYYDDADCRTYI